MSCPGCVSPTDCCSTTQIHMTMCCSYGGVIFNELFQGSFVRKETIKYYLHLKFNKINPYR